MSTSTATVNPNNISLTPQRVTFNGVDLGGTVASVKIKKDIKMSDIMVDQFGKTPIDKVVSGYAYEVTFELAEVKFKPNWKVVFPSDSLITSGPNQSVRSDMQIGDHLLAHSALLNLHPLEASNADVSTDYNFPKAASIQTSEIDYGPEKQSGLKVTMVIFPDLSASPPHFMTYGDPSIGSVSASAGSPTPGANTGNGTIDTVAVFNGVTKAETITILGLDGGGSGNDFVVSGSVSGALGYVHVAAASASQATFIPTAGSPQVINFKIHQGTIEFIAGDSFTIVTTPSNFS